MFIGTVYEMSTTKPVLQIAMGIPNIVTNMNINNNNGGISVLNGHTNKGFVGKQLELHEINLHQHMDIQNGATGIANGVDPQMTEKPKTVIPDVVKLSECILLSEQNQYLNKSFSKRYAPSNRSMLWTYFQL